MKSILTLVALVLLSFSSSAQESCPNGGVLPRYQEARDEHLPGLDGATNDGERYMLESAFREISSGVKKYVARTIGLGPVVPILDNSANIADMMSQDQSARVKGALGILNGTAWKMVSPLELDLMAQGMLDGLAGYPDASIGENLDRMNRAQVYQGGCKNEVWGLKPYDPTGGGEPYEPETRCEALNIDFDLMLAPATERSEVTEDVASDYSNAPIEKALLCGQSGTTPDPDRLMPKFSLAVNVQAIYYLTKMDATSLFDLMKESAIESADHYEARQGVGRATDAFAIAIIQGIPPEQNRVGINAFYLSGNVILHLMYYSGHGLVSSVPSVEAEQQMAEQILVGMARH